MISLSKEELMDFAKDIYEEGCSGYLDLKDSLCYGKVERLFEKINKIAPKDHIVAENQYVVTAYTGGSGPNSKPQYWSEYLEDYVVSQNLISNNSSSIEETISISVGSSQILESKKERSINE